MERVNPKDIPLAQGRKRIHTNLPPLEIDVQAGRALSMKQRDLIRREAARILYLLLHLDDSEALQVAEMNEEAFVAFCVERLP